MSVSPFDTQLASLLYPEAPSSLAETGLSADGISALLLKALYGGEASGIDLADHVRLSYSILEPLVEHLRVERLIEVRQAAGTGTAGYRYVLTDLGRDRTRQALQACGYIGPAPVPLVQYTNYVQAAASNRGHVDRERVAEGFSHLVIEPEMLDQLGPAVSSGRAMFLYGPPGNGKSVMGEGIGRVLGGDIYAPYALDVDGQVIALFDPVNHVRLDDDDDSRVIRAGPVCDRRWVRIRRPVITVGGELTLDMLDLQFNETSTFYEAPIHLKANGGVLVVDDFGRQRVPARDLLNRWIVPLEARIDYLSLQTGRKFQVPFDVLIVFATNLEPRELADEAFLRRIPYKIFAKNPTYDRFLRIFELNCRRYGMPFDPAVVEYLYREHYQRRRLQMRACHPRDLIDQIVNLCRYQEREPAITPELLDIVCRTYFLDEERQTEDQATPR